MKYWVYKDSRILGPFDKDALAGLPGVDASTLVCAGEPTAAAEGSWLPAGSVEGLGGLPPEAISSWSAEPPPSTFGLLDKLQIEAAGLVGDDEFPAVAEDLFQDADLKQTFGDLLAPRPGVDEAELRRSKEKVSELTEQLETLYRRIAELETRQTDLVRRLAEKEIELRRQPSSSELPTLEALLRAVAPPSALPPTPVAPPAASAAPAPAPAAPSPEAFQAPAPLPPAPVSPAPPPSAPTSAVPAMEWPTAAPSEPPPGFAPPAASAAAPLAPAPAAPAQTPPLPPAPEAAAAPATIPLVPAPQAPPSPAQPKRLLFGRPKSFKVVPTVRAFRVVEDGQAPAAAPERAAAETASLPSEAPVVPVPTAPAPAAPPLPAPVLELKVPAPPSSPPPAWAPPPAAAAAPQAPPPMPVLSPAPAPAPSAPPATLTFGAPPPAAAPAAGPFGGFAAADLPAPSAPPAPATAAPAPPATAAFSAFAPAAVEAEPAAAPSTQEVLARLAKPASTPATAPPRAKRSNKPFLVMGLALLALLGSIGFFFLRQPKELKQMAALDDGRARLGAEPVDENARPPLVKPRPAAPPAEVPTAPPTATPAPAPAAPAPVEAPQAASQAKIDAAVAMVKDFPLDGERGTVGRWLQYSYTATPDAGRESWSASETADKTYLVEYRFTPTKAGVPEAHYLFEADMERGFVIGKNLDAKSMLAGGPRGGTEKPRKAKAKAKAKPKGRSPAKRAVKRPAPKAEPKEVPLLPLPEQNELRPPAEDDGAFGSDTVNSGL